MYANKSNTEQIYYKAWKSNRIAIARRELGINPTDRELVFYESFHEFVQNCYQIHSSKSWAKIIMTYCSDEQQGFDRFFELLEKFETSSDKSQQIENNMVEV